MALKVSIDLAACQGYACCMMESPSLFDLDEDSGKAILLKEHPSDERRAEAERALQGVPSPRHCRREIVGLMVSQRARERVKVEFSGMSLIQASSTHEYRNH